MPFLGRTLGRGPTKIKDVGAFVFGPLSDREDVVKKYETLINIIILNILIINVTCHK